MLAASASVTHGSTPEDVHTQGLNSYTQGQFLKAELLIRKAIELAPFNFNFYNTLGEILRNGEQYNEAIEQYIHALSLATESSDGLKKELVGLVWTNLGKVYLIQNHHQKAQKAFEQALVLHPQNSVAHFQLSYTYQVAGQLDKAYASYGLLLKSYLGTEDMTSEQGLDTLLNMGTLETLRGNFEHARELFKQVLHLDPNNSKALNNIGAVSKQLVEFNATLKYLQRAIQAAPEHYAPHVNVASLCYRHGDIPCAQQSYQKALELGGYPALRVRLSTLLPPIMGTWNDIDSVRAQFQFNMISLHAQWQKDGTRITTDPIQTVESLHYYPQYHGLSEYNHQVMMATFYTSMVVGLQWVAPHLQIDLNYSDTAIRNRNRRKEKKKIKIGFMSKFFGDGQPHGMLLEGVVAHLPSDMYEVIVFEVPGSKSNLNPILLKNADQVVKLPLVLSTVRQTLASHDLDVLVLGDSLSEPVNYFVAMGTRVAPVQCMFWGNPITTGGSNIDYFISGDRLETNEGWQEYSEQLVRMEGQAIWYANPTLPGDEIQIEDEKEWAWRTSEMVVYVCPQSTNKIHPDFIDAIESILTRVAHIHLVFLKGRKKKWTEMLQLRLKNTVSSHVYGRIHFVSRMSNMHFLQLISDADVMLHPFPFGGSKTSADGIAVGTPVVVLKTQYLRGRMAYSFFATMKYEETVATTIDDYVEIAVKLGRNITFRKTVSKTMKKRSSVIWERKKYIESWNRFLKRAVEAVVHVDTTTPRSLSH